MKFFKHVLPQTRHQPVQMSISYKKDIDIPTTSKPTQTSVKYIILCNAQSDNKVDLNNRFSIYHQNIRGVKGKPNELLLSLPAEAPHLIASPNIT